MIQTIDAEEQIVKRVVESGTGGIVYAPRKWLGQEVIVILPKQPGDIKERLIGILGPKLEHVIGIYLTGSYARNESAKDSDIDILLFLTANLSCQGGAILILQLLNSAA